MQLHNSIRLIEPVCTKQVMIALNSRIVQHELLVKILPLTADIFVFVYPVYLVALYIWGIRKKDIYFKQAALYLFFSAVAVAVVNFVIQFFVDKQRPETAILDKGNLILDHLPTEPFPSDHAAVSAAIAMATMLWGIRHRDKRFLWASVFLWFACLAMSFSRVAVAIHRPTDILAGLMVGIVCAIILFQKHIR